LERGKVALPAAAAAAAVAAAAAAVANGPVDPFGVHWSIGHMFVVDGTQIHYEGGVASIEQCALSCVHVVLR
jgi:hypothetical protein